MLNMLRTSPGFRPIVYPKVKVRSLEEDNDNFDFPIIPIQGFDSLSIRDSSPPVKGVKSAVSVARIPRSYIPRSITPPPSLPTPANKSELEQDGRKPRVRASSIPRPRAVVSSPDNDQILGTKNKMRLQRPSAMRTPALAQSRQLEGRSTRTSTTKKLLKSSESKATTHANDIKEKKGSSTNVRIPITNVSKAKPGQNKVATRTNDAKEKNVSTLHVRVPISDISKAKPCFMVT